MLGILPYAGIDISLFELTKERLQDAHQGPVPPHLLLGAGMFSSSVGQMVAYPLGFVRTRLQVKPVYTPDRRMVIRFPRTVQGPVLLEG